MPRAARVIAVGVPHHITQRGNNQQDIFVVDEDRRQYLEALAEDSTRYRALSLIGLSLIGFWGRCGGIGLRPSATKDIWRRAQLC